MTYEQKIRAKLDDPATPTAEYRAAWNEWQIIEFQRKTAQREYDAQIAQLLTRPGDWGYRGDWNAQAAD
jgi:hypothetical protein